MARRQSPWIPALAWATVIFATSCTFVPSKTFVKVVGGKMQLVNAGSEPAFDNFWREWWWVFVKGYHVLEYTILTALVYRALRAKLSVGRAVAWAALLALAYASSDEFHQTFVMDRGGRWTDVAIDSIGIGLVVVWVTVSRAKAFNR